MPYSALIFGSSKDLLFPYWRVWTYDDEEKLVIPLAHFNEKIKSDTAAFDLAHAACNLEDSAVIGGILASRDSAPTPLPQKIFDLLAHFAEEAIEKSEAAVSGKSVISVFHRPEDIVYVVKISKRT
jgi:hypothetical protein